MKPRWQDAPDWAGWLAMDENRKWFWHELKPIVGSYYWISQFRCEHADEKNNWKDSLEPRPSLPSLPEVKP